MAVDVMDLNPGIRRIVTWFNDMGFTTIDSGDGKTHDFECDRDYAYVVIKIDPAQMVSGADRLKTILEEHGVCIGPIGPEGDLTPCMQASYDPVQGAAFIDVMNVTDDMLPETLRT